MADEKKNKKSPKRSPEEEAFEVLRQIGPDWLLRTLKVRVHICEGPPPDEVVEGDDLPKEHIPLTVRVIEVLKTSWRAHTKLSQLEIATRLKRNRTEVKKCLQDLVSSHRVRRETKKGMTPLYWVEE